MGARRRESSWNPGRPFLIVASAALAVQSARLLAALFEPRLPYSIPETPDDCLDTERFLKTLQALTNGQIYRGSKIDVLSDGREYYGAEFEAIEGARRSVNVEVFILEHGRIAREFLDLLVTKARAGVEVRLLADAMGSFGFEESYLAPLARAGGRFAWYHPVTWHSWPRINNRTHRNLIVVDSTKGFSGGAGIGDQWLGGQDGKPPWRETMVRVTGDAVTGLQSAFSENWMEATGEILPGSQFSFPDPLPGGAKSLLVTSAPTAGRSTPARVLFQMLIAAARSRILLTTPYFLPDASLRGELLRAVRRRGVELSIVVPGRRSDHGITYRASRRLYGELLQAGARIYEYQPAMMHAKSLVIDGLWSVLGSTNVDPRSFRLNDEVNLAVLDPALARRLEEDFRADVGRSREMSYRMWMRRSWLERAQGLLGAVFEGQQ